MTITTAALDEDTVLSLPWHTAACTNPSVAADTAARSVRSTGHTFVPPCVLHFSVQLGSAPFKSSPLSGAAPTSVPDTSSESRCGNEQRGMAVTPVNPTSRCLRRVHPRANAAIPALVSELAPLTESDSRPGASVANALARSSARGRGVHPDSESVWIHLVLRCQPGGFPKRQLRNKIFKILAHTQSHIIHKLKLVKISEN